MATDSSERCALLNRLADEFANRYRQGLRPSVLEYVDRHPELADDIRAIFPALAEVEQVKEDRQEGSAPASTGPLPPLERVGDYRILREIGRGGMGVVYEAEQVALGRRVALKMLPGKLQLDARQKQRFEREARAAARLHHTNIVPVFGVGEHEGLPYYVMQFIQGRGLNEVMEELKRLQPMGPVSNRPLSARPIEKPQQKEMSAVAVARSLLTGQFQSAAGEADVTADHAAAAGAVPADNPVAGSLADTLSPSSSSVVLPGSQGTEQRGKRPLTYWQSVALIGVQVAGALEYAHKQGVLHRDIKPSNLLLDTGGTVWVTDFGLAKAEDQPNLTHTGDILGTLRYMPPEAFDGKTDARGDIYSLGLTLYELLALRPAFAKTERNHLIKLVTTTVPPRLERLNPALPRDLVTVVHKAIDRDPARRYASADELAADLQRFIDDEPIRARRASLGERCWRWCRHHPAVAILGSLAALLLASVAVVATVAAFHIDAAREEAVEAGKKEAKERQRAQDNADESQRRLVRAQVASGAALTDQGDLHGALPWFAEALRLDQGEPAREEAHRLRLASALHHAPRLAALWNAEDGNGLATFCTDGRRVLVASTPARHLRLLRPARGKGKLWTADVATGRRLVTVALEATLLDFALSPDGKHVATACEDGTAQMWNLQTGRPTGGTLRHAGPMLCIAYSPDGQQLVTGSEDGSARVWDAKTGKEVRILRHPNPVHVASFSPDGRHVVTETRDGIVVRVQVWQLANGKPLWPAVEVEAGTSSHLDIAFSADGARLLIAGGSRVIRTLDVNTGRLRAQSTSSLLGFSWAWLSPDRQRIVSAGTATAPQVWDADTAQPTTAPLSRLRQALTLAFSPQGDTVATGSLGGLLHVWQTTTGNLVGGPLRHGPGILSVAFNPSGRLVVTCDTEGVVRVWDLAGGAAPPSALAPNEYPDDVMFRHTTFCPQARRVTMSLDLVRLWDTQTGQLVGALSAGFVLAKTFSPDGRRLVTGNTAGTARVWDALTSQPLSDWVRHRGWIAHAEFSPDSSLVVTAGQDRIASIWEALTCRQVAELKHDQAVRYAAFSADATLVVTATGDYRGYGELAAPPSDPRRTGEARVWHVATGRPITPPIRHAGAVQRAIFSPDGHRILTLAAGGSENCDRAQVWDAASGQPVSKPMVHSQGVFDMAFSPDGRRVATGVADGSVRLWDVATGQPVVVLSAHSGAIAQLGFSPDGRQLVTASADGTARVWDADSGEPIAVFHHRRAVLHAAFANEGYSVTTACADCTVRTWPLLPDRRAADDWVTLAGVLGGGRSGPGGAVPPGPASLERTWQVLRQKYPHDFSSTTQEQTAWHRGAADDAVARKAWQAALFHLGQVVAFNPASWPDRLARARLLTRLERWDDAQAEFTRACLNHGDVPAVLLARGSFLLARGQRELASADFRKAFDLRATSVAAALSDYWVTGPYGEDLRTASPPELQTDPALPIPSAPGKKDTLRHWRAEQADASGFLNLGACFDHAEHISAYALAYVYSRMEQDIAVLTGSDDSMRLWLNGELVYEYPKGRRSFPDDDRIPARLRAGWNVVLVKVVNHTGGHGLYLRLSAEPADLAAAFLGKGQPEQALEALGARLAAERGKAGEAAVLFERAMVRARLGRWSEAAADSARGLELDPSDHYPWYRAGALCLHLGDYKGYRRHCREMLRRFGATQDPMIAERISKLCFVKPEEAGDLRLPLRLAEQAVDRTERHGLYAFFQLVKGSADCRAGRYEPALSWLQKSEESLHHPLFKAQALLYQAMALHHLGRGAEARQALDQATSMLERHPRAGGDLGEIWFDWIFAQQLHREAAALVQ
jgi:WD40 repeat protein/serine/threonine protein kinase